MTLLMWRYYQYYSYKAKKYDIMLTSGELILI
jgi:hypothetical protein